MNAYQGIRTWVRVAFTQGAEMGIRRAIGENAPVEKEKMLFELRQYLSYAEESGRELDQDGQALRYDDELMIIVKKRDGIWHVIKVWRVSGELVCLPVRAWKRICRGAREFVANVLVGWRYLHRAVPSYW